MKLHRAFEASNERETSLQTHPNGNSAIQTISDIRASIELLKSLMKHHASNWSWLRGMLSQCHVTRFSWLMIGRGYYYILSMMWTYPWWMTDLFEEGREIRGPPITPMKSLSHRMSVSVPKYAFRVRGLASTNTCLRVVFFSREEWSSNHVAYQFWEFVIFDVSRHNNNWTHHWIFLGNFGNSLAPLSSNTKHWDSFVLDRTRTLLWASLGIFRDFWTVWASLEDFCSTLTIVDNHTCAARGLPKNNSPTLSISLFESFRDTCRLIVHWYFQ